MPELIDIRSDTVTRPTPGMMKAMMNAPVGDDVFGEDPTINALQEKAADMLGKEAALFVPSGTMANQIAIKVMTRPAEEVIMAEGAHPFMYEGGGAAVISSVQIKTLPAERGVLKPEDVGAAVRPFDVHQPTTRLVCIENTANRGGGTVYPLETIKAIRDAIRMKGVGMHMDGARLFNAVIAGKTSPEEYSAQFDTVSFCLSKGLGAPVGSMLVSDRQTIDSALRWRKMLGGGMRQAGILAAAGLYALEHNIDRLADDHANARLLADAIADMDGLEINPDDVETNIVIFSITRPNLSPAELAFKLKEKGLLVIPFGPAQIRAVTHLDVDGKDVDRAITILNEVMKQ